MSQNLVNMFWIVQDSTQADVKKAKSTGDAAPAPDATDAHATAAPALAADDATSPVAVQPTDALVSEPAPVAPPAEAPSPAHGAAAVEAVAAAPAPADAPSTELLWAVRGGGGRGRDGAKRHRGLDPVVPVTEDALLDPVLEFYGLGDGFPLKTHLVTRCMDAHERPRRVYYVSDCIRRALMLDETESLKVTATGLKVRARMLHLQFHAPSCMQWCMQWCRLFYLQASCPPRAMRGELQPPC